MLFYFEQDRQIADAVNGIAATALSDPADMPAAMRCGLVPTTSPVLPTTIEIWVDFSRLTYAAPAEAAKPQRCQ